MGAAGQTPQIPHSCNRGGEKTDGKQRGQQLWAGFALKYFSAMLSSMGVTSLLPALVPPCAEDHVPACWPGWAVSPRSWCEAPLLCRRSPCTRPPEHPSISPLVAHWRPQCPSSCEETGSGLSAALQAPSEPGMWQWFQQTCRCCWLTGAPPQKNNKIRALQSPREGEKGMWGSPGAGEGLGESLLRGWRTFSCLCPPWCRSLLWQGAAGLGWEHPQAAGAHPSAPRANHGEGGRKGARP